MGIVDQHGRGHEYLRISVTERCNLRCRYCMPAEGIPLKPREAMLTFGEIETLARTFVSMGVRKIRITGGEPLVRHHVVSLCETLSNIPGVETLAMTTNGVLLEEHAAALKSAGVSNLNISLDTLRPERFAHITRRNEQAATLRGIEAALRAEVPSIKLNTVVIKGFNDDEIADFVQFAVSLSLDIRFIEYMPFAGNGWREGAMVNSADVRAAVERAATLEPLVHAGGAVAGPAREFHIAGSDATVGFISTMSDPFCGSCNRLRLTADGRLRSCIFAKDGADLKMLLRSGAPRQIIEEAIRAEVFGKWRGHPDAETLSREQDRAMVSIGG